MPALNIPALDRREYIILGFGVVAGFALAALIGYYYQAGKYDVEPVPAVPMHGVPIIKLTPVRSGLI